MFDRNDPAKNKRTCYCGSVKSYMKANESGSGESSAHGALEEAIWGKMVGVGEGCH